MSPAGCGPQMLAASPEALGWYDSDEARWWNEYTTGTFLQNQYRHYPRMDAIARHRAKRAGIAILDSAPIYLRVDAHPGSFLPPLRDHNRTVRMTADCLHFCLNPTGPMSLLPVLLHHTLMWL